jgi:Flp pilus assembly protein TadG
MSPVSSSGRPPRLGREGTTSLEFALVAVAFFSIMFACMDLGRYFITQHSLRTLTSELIRATLVQCSGTTSACSLSATNIEATEAKVPFLVASAITLSPVPTRSAVDPSTGVMTVTASASYAFTFTLPVLSSLSGPISNSTQLSY